MNTLKHGSIAVGSPGSLMRQLAEFEDAIKGGEVKIVRTSLRDTTRSEEFTLTEEMLANICKWNGAGDKQVKEWLAKNSVVYTTYSMWRVPKIV